MNWLEDLEYSGFGERKLEFLLACLALSGLGVFHPLLSLIGPAMLVGLPVFLAEMKRARLKKELPSIALEISTLWGILPMDEILIRVKNKELNKVGKAIKAGVPPIKAFEGTSRELDPIVKLLKNGYKTGGDISLAMRHLAEDLAEEEGIKEEINSSLSVEKLTMIGGTIVIPFVLGITNSLARSLDYSGLSIIGKGTIETSRMAFIGNSIYVIEYAIIAGLYLGLVEGNMKKSLLYSTALALVSFFIYNIALGFKP